MKILSNNDGWEVYRRTFNLIHRAKISYESSYSSGRTIHAYGNYVNTAQAALTLLNSKLNQNISVEELQVYTDSASRLAYDLLMWVGKL